MTIGITCIAVGLLLLWLLLSWKDQEGNTAYYNFRKGLKKFFNENDVREFCLFFGPLVAFLLILVGLINLL